MEVCSRFSREPYRLGPAIGLSHPENLLGTEGFDYLTTDSAGRILHISRENHIDADIGTSAIVRRVTGLDGTNGLLPVPEFGRAFATNEDKSEVRPVDPP